MHFVISGQPLHPDLDPLNLALGPVVSYRLELRPRRVGVVDYCALAVYEEHMEISIQTLTSLVRYDPLTGGLTWLTALPSMFENGKKHSAETRCAIWNAKYSGKPALTYREPNRPYAYGDILGKKHYAHRVAVALMTGEWPSVVDHIDGDKTNNAWSNIRNVSKSDNAKNCVLRSDNASGYPGVYFDTSRQQWAAEIFGNGRKVFLGRYCALQDAIAARLAAQTGCGYSARHGTTPQR